MRWTGHVACMVQLNIYKTFIRKQEGKGPLGRPRLDGRIILDWILKK
jgi:hypothetical protein